MGKPKATESHSHTGIKHSTSSNRTHEHSSRGLDWFWLILALLAIAVIAILEHLLRRKLTQPAQGAGFFCPVARGTKKKAAHLWRLLLLPMCFR